MSHSSPTHDGQAAPRDVPGIRGIARKYPRAVALSAWCTLMVMGVLSHGAASLRIIVPLLMVALPFLLTGAVRFRLSRHDCALGTWASLILVAPLILAGLVAGRTFAAPGIAALAYQLFAVSLPEETFFRGYLQEVLGNRTRALLVTSALFTAAHMPRALFLGEWHLILTFFPSLVMGWLYMRTGNILPGIIFHFAANTLFLAWSGGGG